MAINPLQLPEWRPAPMVDFTPLGEIGAAYARARERQADTKAKLDYIESLPTKDGPAPATAAAPPSATPAKAAAPMGNVAFDDPKDFDLAVRTVVGEAGNQPIDGKVAVAHVIANRARQAGMRPGEVVLAPGQFEPWNNPRTRKQLATLDPNSPAYQEAAQAVTLAWSGQAADPTGGADHFFAPKAQAALGRAEPTWAAGAQGQDIGDHRFFKLGYGGQKAAPAPAPAAADLAAAAAADPRMTELEKARIKRLFEGGPTSQALGMQLLQRFMGKQGPTIVPQGATAIDGSGRVIYQAPSNGQFSLEQIERPDGSKAPVSFDKRKGTATPVVTPPGTPDPSIPPGADLKKVREERGKAFVGLEEEAVKSAKAAADLKPFVDEAADAYRAAVQAGATGPLNASFPNRNQATYVGLWGAESEKLRQRYDKALAALQARITAAQNKGEGAVSDFERRLYAAQFPSLTALDGADQLRMLDAIQAQTVQTIAAGRRPAIGAPAGTVLDRPGFGPRQQAAGRPQPAPAAGATREQLIEEAKRRGLPLPPGL